MLAICDMTMPLQVDKGHSNKQRNTYWWNQELTTLREHAAKSRRRLHKAYRRKNTSEAQITALRREYQANKRVLKNRIRRAKGRAWDNFCRTLNEDASGRPYKAVMKAMKNKEGPVSLSKEDTTKTVEKLFCTIPEDTYALGSMGAGRHSSRCPPITTDEVQRALKKISSKKAPGIDQIPIGVLREIFKHYPTNITAMFQNCLTNRYFPDMWKVQKLILLPKGKFDAEGRP